MRAGQYRWSWPRILGRRPRRGKLYSLGLVLGTPNGPASAGSGNGGDRLTVLSPTLRGRRGIVVGFLALLATAAAFIQVAEARHFPHHASSGHAASSHSSSGGHVEHSSPPYAAIVVDANSGALLHAANPDELRHPASLTKIMTLYLLFERLEGGKLRLDSQLEVSEHAAAQSPTKLGLRPGQTIAVEDAIGGLVTRSANDAAVVVAEAIGGSEHDFADMMTRKAHALGMTRTLYRNASGLPNDEQVTTARDQALLGRAIQERFPRYYRFFSMTSFAYHGAEIRNHNHLLGHVEGVDGIKTGYTEASGFNLVTSVHRSNRHIVAVVLGGASAASRDARMKTLIEEYIVAASSHKSAIAVAEGSSGPNPAIATAREVRNLEQSRAGDARTVERAAEPVLDRIARAFEGYAALAQAPSPAKEVADARDNRVAESRPQTRAEPVYTVASASSRPAAAAPQGVAPPAAEIPATTPFEREPAALNRAAEPIKPIQVKTVKVKLPANQLAALAPGSSLPAEEHPGPTEATPLRSIPTGVSAAASVSIPLPREAVREVSEPRNGPIVNQRIANVATAGATPRGGASPNSASDSAVPAHVAVTERGGAVAVHSGWIIQIGAFEAEREAREKLSAVKAKASQMLRRADPFTEPVVKGDKTFYRARFAGLQKDEAEAICRQLKRNDIACMTIKN